PFSVQCSPRSVVTYTFPSAVPTHHSFSSRIATAVRSIPAAGPVTAEKVLPSRVYTTALFSPTATILSVSYASTSCKASAVALPASITSTPSTGDAEKYTYPPSPTIHVSSGETLTIAFGSPPITNPVETSVQGSISPSKMSSNVA